MRDLPRDPEAAGAPPPTAPPGTTTADDRSTAFRPVVGGGELQSGEKLLVEAYAAIWVILFAMVLFSWRRQRAMDGRMNGLEGALAKARAASKETETEKGSA